LVGARPARDDRADTMPTPPAPRPGLAKVRAAPLVARRTLQLTAAPAGRWQGLVEHADVVSEGRTVDEEERRVYYGSTSVILPGRSVGGELPDAEVPALAALIRADPHVRLQVLRVARREAEARAGGPLTTLRAEIDVRPDSRGVSLLVEVVARVAPERVRAATR
jgi:hypothetical protein